MPLFDDSGQTQEQRTQEVNDILERLVDMGFSASSEKEQKFVDDMLEKIEKDWFKPSAKQLFWLRDIISKS